jgi:hypothetical protein
MRAVEKLTRYRNRIGTIPTECPRSTLCRSIASIPLLAESTSVSRRSSSTDAILRMATTSTRYEWALFTQHSVDRRSVFYSWGCVQRSQQSPLGTGESSCCPRTWVSSVSSLSVRACIVGDIVVGPYVLPDRLNSQGYRDFMETILPGLFEDVPLAVRQRSWFQHDGAPAHYGEDVRRWLNSK